MLTTTLALLALQWQGALPDASRLAEGQSCYTVSSMRDGQAIPMGVTRQMIRRERDGERAVLRITVHQVIGGGAFDMRDDFVVDASTLAPISLVNTRQGKVHVNVTFGPDRIQGWRMTEGNTVPIDVPLERPIWDGNLYGLLFASLPLAEGARFAVPFWQYDKGFGQFTVRVTGSEMVGTPTGPTEAWVLDAGSSDEQRLTYLISKSDHRELGYRAGRGSQALGGDCSALTP